MAAVVTLHLLDGEGCPFPAAACTPPSFLRERVMGLALLHALVGSCWPVQRCAGAAAWPACYLTCACPSSAYLRQGKKPHRSHMLEDSSVVSWMNEGFVERDTHLITTWALLFALNTFWCTSKVQYGTSQRYLHLQAVSLYWRTIPLNESGKSCRLIYCITWRSLCRTMGSCCPGWILVATLLAEPSSSHSSKRPIPLKLVWKDLIRLVATDFCYWIQQYQDCVHDRRLLSGGVVSRLTLL